MVPSSTLLALVPNLPQTIPNLHKSVITRCKQVSLLPKYYDTRINTDIKELLSQLIEILDITD